MSDLVRIEKWMSKLLRHDPDGLQIDERGYINVVDLLKKTKISKDFLEEVVNTSSKKRFSFNEDKTKIKANQGHSLDIKHDFKEFIPKDFLFHGTSVKFLDSIKESGIKHMHRHHVHLSLDKETARKVGSRKGKPVILKIDSLKMHEDKVKFFISENNVVLTDFVDSKYISEFIFNYEQDKKSSKKI